MNLDLFEGGPLYRLMVRLGMGGCSRRQVIRRIVLWVAVLWLPPFMLAEIGSFLSASVPTVSILGDFPFHVRCLVAVPILIAAECHVARHLSDAIPILMARGLISDGSREAIERVKSRIQTLRCSSTIELCLLIAGFAYVASRIYIDLPEEASSWQH